MSLAELGPGAPLVGVYAGVALAARVLLGVLLRDSLAGLLAALGVFLEVGVLTVVWIVLLSLEKDMFAGGDADAGNAGGIAIQGLLELAKLAAASKGSSGACARGCSLKTHRSIRVVLSSSGRVGLESNQR